MTERPSETVELHTSLMKCALEIENSRAYWQHVRETGTGRIGDVAFEEHWFGARSRERVALLMSVLRSRFDAFPTALHVLSGWTDMDPDERRLICHWHLQLSDPLYRAFTGRYLLNRHDGIRAEITRDLVVAWVDEQAPGRWKVPTRIKFASKLLSAAYSAGLVSSNRDPRPLRFPRVADRPLTYLLYLLREVEFSGTLLDNPYVASVGLQDPVLDQRLRGLKALRFRRQGDLLDFGWRHANLTDWAAATVFASEPVPVGAMV